MPPINPINPLNRIIALCTKTSQVSKFQGTPTCSSHPSNTQLVARSEKRTFWRDCQHWHSEYEAQAAHRSWRMIQWLWKTGCRPALIWKDSNMNINLSEAHEIGSFDFWCCCCKFQNQKVSCQKCMTKKNCIDCGSGLIRKATEHDMMKFHLSPLAGLPFPVLPRRPRSCHSSSAGRTAGGVSFDSTNPNAWVGSPATFIDPWVCGSGYIVDKDGYNSPGIIDTWSI